MRGQIQHREYKQRIIDGTKLRYGAVTFSDLDAYFEFGDRARVLIELKYSDAPLSIGQNLALTRFIDDMRAAGKSAILIVVTYYQAQGDLPLHDLPVRRIYLNGHWKSVTHRNVKQVMDAFLIACNINLITGKLNAI